MPKVMVGVNTLSVLDRLAYSNHCQFWFRLGRNFGPEWSFAFNTPPRMSIDRMRNQTAQIALENDFDYVLFLDDDVLVPKDGLKQLLDAEADIAAGWTIIRGYPFKNMFFQYGDESKSLTHTEDKDFKFDEKGNILCDAIGFSFCLIKCDLLRKLPKPWFVTGTQHTEDVYFCIKARQHFPDTSIVVVPDCKTGHIVGSEIIEPNNRDAYRTFMESCYGDVLPKELPKEAIARGDEYIQRIEDAKQNS